MRKELIICKTRKTAVKRAAWACKIVMERFRSCVLSEKSYLDEVGKGELENLRLELSALGFGKRAIDKAYQNVETIDK